MSIAFLFIKNSRNVCKFAVVKLPAVFHVIEGKIISDPNEATGIRKRRGIPLTVTSGGFVPSTPFERAGVASYFVYNPFSVIIL